MSDDPTDSALFVQADFGRAWQQHRPRLLQMLERRIGPDQRSRFDPEDVLSEASLVALGRWPEFCRQHLEACNKGGKDEKTDQKPPMSEYAWLYRIALDALIGAWRREHRKRSDQDRDVPYPDRSSIQLEQRIMSPVTLPEDACAREELRTQVRQALDALPLRQRQILLMHRIEGIDVKDVAAILDLDLRTVYREIERAVKQLGPILRTTQPPGERL